MQFLHITPRISQENTQAVVDVCDSALCISGLNDTSAITTNTMATATMTQTTHHICRPQIIVIKLIAIIKTAAQKIPRSDKNDTLSAHITGPLCNSVCVSVGLNGTLQQRIERVSE